MFKVYSQTKHCYPIVVSIVKRGRIKGLLLAIVQWNGGSFTKLFTARSIIIGGPLAVNNNEQIVKMLLSEYKRVLPKYVIYSEVRPIYDMAHIFNSLIGSGYKRVGHYNLMLDIRPNKQRLYDNLHKERQRNIRQAEKAGLVFKEVDKDSEIQQISNLIELTYKRKRVPLIDTSIFLQAKQLMPEYVHFFAAYKDSQMIARQVRLCYKGLVYAWYAGSNEQYFKLRPNDFLMWNVICWAHDNGYKIFDFGGGGEPNKPYGVRDYKLKYGCKMYDYGRYLHLLRPISYHSAKMLMTMLGIKK
ncbi:MAG: GNAT family N-acetyltransferase [Paludibacteraceae bacterium]|nr:GNAT family N-acetyltransferase [Paludibacteraceae bacterium]